MKTIALFIVSAIAVSAQTVTVAITVTAILGWHGSPVAVGNAVAFDSEPMAVTAVTPVSGGLQLTLSRGTMPNATMAAHAIGAQGFLLKYSSPWEMIVDEALRPWTFTIIRGLGSKSVTLASGATGVITQ